MFDTFTNYTTVALIPAHNEARFIGSVVLEARQHVKTVVVVDDGSADSTANIAQAAGATVLQLEKNVGKAGAIMAGLALMAHNAPHVVVMLDGDGQHNAAEIPHLLEPIATGSADLVIGTRFSSIQSDIPAWRQVGQHTLTQVTNLASGVHLTDSQSGFRAFSAEVLPLLNFATDGFSLESEMQFIIRKHELRVSEVPISVVYAEAPKRNPITHGLQVLNGIIKLVGMSRPLLFFCVPGITSLLLGFAMGLLIMRIYQQSTELAVGYALICIMLLIIGTTSLSTGVILYSLRTWLVNWQRQN
ncbi:MAG: glycosyltransferase family 2 protein [Candidatus Promineifilaceae bacterium]